VLDGLYKDKNQTSISNILRLNKSSVEAKNESTSSLQQSMRRMQSRENRLESVIEESSMSYASKQSSMKSGFLNQKS